MFHRVLWVWWADACYVLDPLLWGVGSAQEGPALMVRIPQRALVDVCVAGVACRGGWWLSLSSLSPGPRLHRPPSSRLCSPTTPRGKAQGTAGDVALSECDSLTRR